MKNILKIKVAVIALLMGFTLTACNNQKQEQEDNSDANLQELKTELKSAIQDVENNKLVEFKKESQTLLDDLRSKIEEYETRLSKEEQTDLDTQKKLKELKIEVNELETKLNKLDNDNEENMAELKEEIKHDFSELGNSIENFFSDNL